MIASKVEADRHLYTRSAVDENRGYNVDAMRRDVLRRKSDALIHMHAYVEDCADHEHEHYIGGELKAQG